MPTNTLSPAVKAAIRQRCREIYKSEASRPLKRGRENIVCDSVENVKTKLKHARGEKEKTFPQYGGGKTQTSVMNSDVVNRGDFKFDSNEARKELASVIGSNKQRASEPFPAQAEDECDVDGNVLSALLPKNTSCSTCGVKFLTSHQQKAHEQNFKEKKHQKLIHPREFRRDLYMKLICPYIGCCFKYNTLEEMDQHVESSHDETDDKLPDLGDLVPIYQNDNRVVKSGSKFVCPQCRRLYESKAGLNKHLKKCTGSEMFNCEFCQQFTSSKYLEVLQHMNEAHRETPGFVRLNAFRAGEEVVDEDDENTAEVENLKISKKQKEVLENDRLVHSFRTTFTTFSKIFSEEYTEIADVLSEENFQQAAELLRLERARNENIHFQLCIPAICRKITTDGLSLEVFRTFRTNSFTLYGGSSIGNALVQAFNKIAERVGSIEEEGSGWVLGHCRRLDVIIQEKPGMRGGDGEDEDDECEDDEDDEDDDVDESGKITQDPNYTQNIDVSPQTLLPDLSSRGILNIKTSNKKCLLYAVLYQLNHEEILADCEHDMRTFLKVREDGKIYNKFKKSLNLKNCAFPAGLETIFQLEANNPLLRFHVYQARGGDYYPVYKTGTTEKMESLIKQANSDEDVKNIHLIISHYVDRKDRDVKVHWFAVSNLNVFLATRYGGVGGKNDTTRRLDVCPHCCATFSKAGTAGVFTEKYLKHRDVCRFNTLTDIRMPLHKNMFFKNIKNSHHARFSIYADFETTNTPLPDMCGTCYELYSEAPAKEGKQLVVEECLQLKHTPNKFNGCATCTQKYVLINKTIKSTCFKVHNPSDTVEKKVCRSCQIKRKIAIDKIDHDKKCDASCTECSGRDRCSHSSTALLTRLDPILWCCVIYDQKHDEIFDTATYIGYDCVSKFLDFLIDYERRLTKEIDKYQQLTEDEKNLNQKHFDSQTNCYSCGVYFNRYSANRAKRWDHCHITGKFRGAACNFCNMKMVELRKVPVFFHNLQGFDSHLIASEYKNKKREL